MKKLNSSPKIRLSYSLLDLWSKNRFDEAVALYLHKPLPTNKQIEDGKAFHHKWGNTIKKDKKLILGQTTLKFDYPEVEKVVVVDYSDHFTLKGVFDCLDGDILYEFKTGTTSISDYIRTYQLPFYFLLGELGKIPLTQANLIHYNQHTKENEYFIVWNSPYQIEKAKNFIDSLAGELRSYFISHKVPLEK